MANIDQDVKMVEFELKDTPDADKKPIQDELDTIKKKIHDDKVAKFRPDIEKSLESYFTNAKEALADNRPDAAVGEADRLDEYLTHDDIKEVFTDDEIAKYKERMNKLRLMGQSGMADAKITIMEKDFGDYEKAFPGKLTELKGDNEGQAQMLVNSMSQELGVYATHMNDLPADNDKVKAPESAAGQAQHRLCLRCRRRGCRGETGLAQEQLGQLQQRVRRMGSRDDADHV